MPKHATGRRAFRIGFEDDFQLTHVYDKESQEWLGRCSRYLTHACTNVWSPQDAAPGAAAWHVTWICVDCEQQIRDGQAAPPLRVGQHFERPPPPPVGHGNSRAARRKACRAAKEQDRDLFLVKRCALEDGDAQGNGDAGSSVEQQRGHKAADAAPLGDDQQQRAAAGGGGGAVAATGGSESPDDEHGEFVIVPDNKTASSSEFFVVADDEFVDNRFRDFVDIDNRTFSENQQQQ